MIYYRLFMLLKLRVSKRFFFFLEVRLGCGSSTKIKTADIQQIMCATGVTLKEKIGPQCVLGILCLVLFLSVRMLCSMFVLAL